MRSAWFAQAAHDTAHLLRTALTRYTPSPRRTHLQLRAGCSGVRSAHPQSCPSRRRQRQTQSSSGGRVAGTRTGVFSPTVLPFCRALRAHPRQLRPPSRSLSVGRPRASRGIAHGTCATRLSNHEAAPEFSERNHVRSRASRSLAGRVSRSRQSLLTSSSTRSPGEAAISRTTCWCAEAPARLSRRGPRATSARPLCPVAGSGGSPPISSTPFAGNQRETKNAAAATARQRVGFGGRRTQRPASRTLRSTRLVCLSLSLASCLPRRSSAAAPAGLALPPALPRRA